MTYISSQSLLSPVRRSVLQAQSGLAQAQAEISSGTKADLGAALGAEAGRSVSMKIEIDRLDAYANSNAVAATRLDGTATTLGAMIKAAQSMSSSLVAASSAGGSTSGLQAGATSALQALISGLNTSVGGQYVFAGINSAVQPVSDYSAASASKQAVDRSFSQAFGFPQADAAASSIGGSDMARYLDDGFDAQFGDAGWASGWSKASDQTISTTLAPGQSASTSVSANATAFRKIAEAYTMLSEFTGSTMSADAKAAVVAKATTLVQAGLSALTDAQSGVGAAQSAIDQAGTRIGAQITVLKGNVSDLDGVDTYALSTRVTALQTQLEASYELTSRLQQLSLVNYLNG